jgi:hypothetical protein
MIILIVIDEAPKTARVIVDRLSRNRLPECAAGLP